MTRRTVGIGSLLSLIIVGTWLGFGWWVPTFLGSDRGSFGDSFGGVAALFSGLALAAVIVTLYLQIQELSQQREALRTQTFEAGFFRLLDLHFRERARYPGPQKDLEPGEPALRLVVEEVLLRAEGAFEEAGESEVSLNWEVMRSELIGPPMWSWLREISVDAYASRLALLVLLLERSPDPEFHGEVLRASLTAYEMMFLVVIALDQKTSRLAALISRFGFAEKVPGKLGPTPQVAWLIKVMTAYADSRRQ